MYPKIFILLIFIFVCYKAQSQPFLDFVPGEITLKNGEAKTGFVKLRKQKKPGVYYRSTEKTKAVFFPVSVVREVRIGSEERYLSYCTADSSNVQDCQWLNTLVEGKVSLHRKTKGGNEFLLEEDSIYYSIRINTFPGVVRALENKCASFKNENNSYRYSSNSLIKMTLDYINCKYIDPEEPKIYKEEGLVVQGGLRIGLGDGQFKIGENLFAERFFLEGGFQTPKVANFALPIDLKIGRNWGMRIGLLVSNFSAKRDSVNLKYLFDPVFARIKFSFNFVELPIMIQYNLKERKLHPFIQSGVHTTLSYKSNLKYFAANSNNPISYQLPPFSFYKQRPPEIFGGVGLNVFLKPKLKLQILALYCFRRLYFVHDIPAFQTQSLNEIQLDQLQLSTGLSWRFTKLK